MKHDITSARRVSFHVAQFALWKRRKNFESSHLLFKICLENPCLDLRKPDILRLPIQENVSKLVTRATCIGMTKQNSLLSE